MATGNLTLAPKNITECLDFPANVHSEGILNYNTAAGMPHTLPNLEMQMVLIFLVTKAFYAILRYLGVPRFTTQIITGLFLGPTFLGKLPMLKQYLFNLQSQEIIGVLSEFGYGLFMFLIGVKMDLGMIMRTGQKALCTGVACVVVPLVVGILVQTQLTSSYFNLTEQEIFKLSFVTASHCLTPFPVVACLLEDLKILNSEIGRLGMSAALVSDICSVFLQFVGTIARMVKQEWSRFTILGIGSSIGYIIVVASILRPAMYWVIRHTPKNRPVKKAYLNIIIVVVLSSGVLSHMYGQSFHFGPFILGLAVPAGPPLGSAIEANLGLFVSDVLLPIFVTTCSMRVDFSWLSYFKTDAFTQINGILIVLVLVTKFLASIVPPLYCNLPFSDALTVALILSCKGIVNLAAYTDLRDNQIINDPSYVLAITSILVTATLVPIAVKYLYDPSRKYAGYQKRNMMHLKPNAELKILACIHRSANMPAVINLLDAACPSKENPIGVYVLHLIELVGRASPIFISHELHKNSVSNVSYSDDILLYFNQFVRENLGAVSLSLFTAISAPKYMYEDICHLALDKLVSLIVLPFHRRWSIDGSVESEDINIRTLNCGVLDRAPCSVGILVDRSHLGRSTSTVSPQSSFSVAIIFLGGKDDREAIAFSKRMAKDSTISLTVIRLVPRTNEAVGSDWDLDTEGLKYFRDDDVDERFVMYLEEAVKDGPQTALLLRSIVDQYDLIIVGRRYNVQSPQTAGLSEWTEFPELGTVGDLLASPDINCRASILVVQQQRMVTK